MLQLFQSTLMKRSVTEFGSVLRTFLPVFWLKIDFKRDNLLKFLEIRLRSKSLQWIPILVATNKISKNRLVHRCYPLVHFDKWVRNKCSSFFILQKKYFNTWRALKIKLSLRKLRKIVRKRVYIGTSFLRNFRSLIYNL